MPAVIRNFNQEEARDVAAPTTHYRLTGGHEWKLGDYREFTRLAAPNAPTVGSKPFSVSCQTAKGRVKLDFGLVANLNGSANDPSSNGCVGLYLWWLNAKDECFSDVGLEELPIHLWLYIRRGEEDIEYTVDIRDKVLSRSFPCLGSSRFIPHRWIEDNRDDVIQNGAIIVGCTFQILFNFPQQASEALLRLQNAIEYNEEDLSGCFETMLEKGNFSDVRIICRGKSFDCHKVVLAARSDVFRTMFADKDKEVSNVVDISDADPGAVGELVRFMYTGKCDSMQDNALDLLQLACKYKICDLKALSEVWLSDNLTVATAADILVQAEAHSLEDLTEITLDYVATHIECIQYTDGWNKLSKRCPNILKRLLETISNLGSASMWPKDQVDECKLIVQTAIDDHAYHENNMK